jgi:hypothetical protein
MDDNLHTNRPYRADEPAATPLPASETNRAEGTGAIVAVVAVAMLIIAGMLYIMQPPSDVPASRTTEAPVTTPAPAPSTPAPTTK